MGEKPAPASEEPEHEGRSNSERRGHEKNGERRGLDIKPDSDVRFLEAVISHFISVLLLLTSQLILKKLLELLMRIRINFH